LFNLYTGRTAVAIVNSFQTELSLKIVVAAYGNRDRYGGWKTIQHLNAGLFLHGVFILHERQVHHAFSGYQLEPV
jgi:hypothetical protein